MEKSCRKCALKASPRPLLILRYKLKQPLQGRNSFKSKIFERGLSKNLKKVNFIFSFEPSPF